jgi:hypothetical protein
MLSKNKLSFLVAILIGGSQWACNPSASLKNESQDLIGSPLEKISKVYSYQGSTSEELALFDKVIGKIHVFNVSTMKHLRTLSPLQPEKRHTVIHHPSGSYTIDLSEKSVGIYGKNGNKELNPVQFQGTPISAAFNPQQNIFVFYDSNNNVTILRMSANGNVLQSFVGGPQLSALDSIRAGDVLQNGDLILGLSNRKVIIVDVNLTLTNQQWEVRQELSPTLSSAIRWIAPLENESDWVMYSNSEAIGILNITNGSIQERLINNLEPILFSKSLDPHVILKDGDTSGRIEMFFVKNQLIESRALSQQNYILDSFLSQKDGLWNFVESPQYNYDWATGATWSSERKIKSFRLNDLVSRANWSLPEKTDLLITTHYLLNLFPSDMGYATSLRIDNGNLQEAKYFNNQWVR